MRLIAIAGALLVVGLAVTAGVLEGALATPETDESEFGVGYLFVFISIGYPLVATTLTLWWLTVTSGEHRVASAIGRGVFAGIFAFLGLIFVADLLSSLVHS